MYYNGRQLGIARNKESFRATRRNRARKPEDWVGVAATSTRKHPPLVQIKSKRGEVSYRELWD